MGDAIIHGISAILTIAVARVYYIRGRNSVPDEISGDSRSWNAESNIKDLSNERLVTLKNTVDNEVQTRRAALELLSDRVFP